MRNRYEDSISRNEVTRQVPYHLKQLLISASFLLCYPQYATGDNSTATNKNLECTHKASSEPCISKQRKEPNSRNSFNEISDSTKIQFGHRSVLISEYDLLDNETGIEFTRYYNSANNKVNYGFGSGWSSNFHNRLLFRSSNHLQLLLATGGLVDFYRAGNTYLANSAFFGKIVKQGNYLAWKKNNTESHIFKGSLPVKITLSDGSFLTLHYVDNLLQEIRKDSKTSVAFHYNSRKQVSKVLLPDNRTLHYEYQHNLLMKVVSKNVDLKKSSAYTTSLNYNYQTEKRSHKPSIISGTNTSSNGYKRKLFDIAYTKQNVLIKLTDYINNHDINITEPDKNSELHSNGVDSVVNIASINCAPCRAETNIYFSQYGHSIGLKRGGFQASWQQHKKNSEYIISPITKTISEAKQHAPDALTVNVVDRDIYGRPTQINSMRFGSATINFENAGKSLPSLTTYRSSEEKQGSATPLRAPELSSIHATVPTSPRFFSVSNAVNTILYPLTLDAGRQTFQSSERTPYAMAEESSIILHLDTLARALTPEHCQIPGYPLPSDDEVNAALDSIPEQQGEAGNSECESGTADPGTDHTSNNLPALFGPATHNGNFLDIRPQDCNSYFDIRNPIRRGNAIEEAVSSHENYSNAIHTVHWFPAVDFVLNRTAVVQISRDLNVQSYSASTNPNALFNRIIYEGRMINERFLEPLAEYGFVTANDRNQSTTIRQDQIDELRFELIVQQGTISPAQQIQIELAREELLLRYNIHFRIVNIP